MALHLPADLGDQVRLTHIDRLKTGARIGREIPAVGAAPLAVAGQTVDQSLIERLRRCGISRVYTFDPLTDDLEVVDVISESTRDRALEIVADAFAGIGSSMALRGICAEMIEEVQASEGAVQGAVPIYPLSDQLVAHSVHSTVYALLIGDELRMDRSALMSLGMGMLLHDIGSAQFSTSIEVPGQLSERERAEFEQHTRAGFAMLRDLLNAMPLGRSIALCHHERLDGSGYPRGLSGQEIPELVRIASIADVFTAMISDRHHRQAMVNDEAISYLLTQGLTKFDTDYTVALANRVEVYPTGVWVRLRDGRAGIAQGSRRGACVRPLVRILEDENGVPLREPQDLDLALHTDVFIADVFLD